MIRTTARPWMTTTPCSALALSLTLGLGQSAFAGSAYVAMNPNADQGQTNEAQPSEREQTQPRQEQDQARQEQGSSDQAEPGNGPSNAQSHANQRRHRRRMPMQRSHARARMERLARPRPSDSDHARVMPNPNNPRDQWAFELAGTEDGDASEGELRLVYRRPLTDLHLNTDSTRAVDYRRMLKTGVIISQSPSAHIATGGQTWTRRAGHRHPRFRGPGGHFGWSTFASDKRVRIRFTDLGTPEYDTRGVIRPGPPIARRHDPIEPAGGRDLGSVIRRQRRQALDLDPDSRSARVMLSPNRHEAERSDVNAQPIMIIPKPEPSSHGDSFVQRQD